MSDRLPRGLAAAAAVRASAPHLRAWVIVHPVSDAGAARFRTRWIEVDEKWLGADVDLDRALLARDESLLVASLDEVARELARAGASLDALGDPRDCACPI
jgi:hypothetical protein